jgi:hypothetical protein
MRSVGWAGLWLAAAILGCEPKDNSAARAAHSQRERDSILGASQLPGARGVRGALDASDSAEARKARLDSIP